jgi:hypothetical protein
MSGVLSGGMSPFEQGFVVGGLVCSFIVLLLGVILVMLVLEWGRR